MEALSVSIVVPVFNKGAFVRRTLESIAAQTCRGFEAIVIDDGSTDDSARVVLEFISETGDNRFRLITQANAGPGAARNRGASEASSEWLAFLDADDEWAPSFLERSLSIAQRGDTASVTSAYTLRPADVCTVEMWRKRGLRDGPVNLTLETRAIELVQRLAFISPCTTIIRSDVFRAWGGFYEKRCRYGEDANLFLKVLLNETVTFNLESLASFNTHASDLAGGQVRRTPTEPFLSDPGQVREACPPELRGLLDDFLAIRALKRACVLGYWGAANEARDVRRKFTTWRHWRLPYFFPALVAGSSTARLLAPAARRVLSGRTG